MVLGCTKLRKVRMEDRRIAFERKTQCTLLPFFFFFSLPLRCSSFFTWCFFVRPCRQPKVRVFQALRIRYCGRCLCTVKVHLLAILFTSSSSASCLSVVLRCFFCAIFTIVGIEKRPLFFFFLVLVGLLWGFFIFCASVRLVVVPACRTDSHAADLASGVHLCSRTRRTAAAARLPRRACCVVQHQDRGW